MKTITANMPAREMKSASGKVFKLDACTDTYTCSGDGKWAGEFGAMFKEDVIRLCKKATNWKEIRAENFPMEGFHA